MEPRPSLCFCCFCYHHYLLSMTETHLEQPQLPAVPDYPTRSPWSDEIDETRRVFLQELGTHDGWQDAGEKQGVRLSKKHRDHVSHEKRLPFQLDADPCSPPQDTSEPLPPSIAGALVQMLNSPHFHRPGAAHPWRSADRERQAVRLSRRRRAAAEYEETLGRANGVRHDDEALLGERDGSLRQREPRLTSARAQRNEVLFYALTKGKKFIASPRDMSGIQKDYIDSDGSCMIIQHSVDTDDVPEQPGAKRADLSLSGWHFKPEGAHTRVSYIFQVDLRGSIPSSIVGLVATETPLCIARARDLFFERGFSPFVRHDTSRDPAIIFQTELIDPEPHSREYSCTITTGDKTGESFVIAYDLHTMYKPEGGVKISLQGESDAVQAQDDGKGLITVTTRASGKTVTIILRPR